MDPLDMYGLGAGYPTGDLGALLQPPPQLPGVPPTTPPMPNMGPTGPAPAAGGDVPLGGSVPETVAAHFARMGIGPQGVIQAQPGQFGAAPSLGESLSPAPTASAVPMPPSRPMDISPGANGGSTAMSANAAKPQGDVAQRLLQTLKGVQMPPNPTIPKINTPSVPGPHGQIKGGTLLALLQSLGGQAPQIPSLTSAIR